MFRTHRPDAAASAWPRPAGGDGAPPPRQDAASPALAGVPAGLHALLLEGCAEWTVPAGRLLLPQDQRADVCYGLATGVLRLHREDPQGRPLVLALLDPGQWVGCTHMFGDTPLPFGVTTVTRSTLLVLRKSTLQQLLERRPAETLEWFAKAAAAQVDSLVAQMGMLATGTVEDRLTWLLGVLAARAAVPSGTFRRVLVRLTQSEMGFIVGASRQRVNKTLGMLQRQGRLRIVDGWLEIASAASDRHSG